MVGRMRKNAMRAKARGEAIPSAGLLVHCQVDGVDRSFEEIDVEGDIFIDGSEELHREL